MIVELLRSFAGHWRRNPLQLFTLMAGLALATALWSGVQAINAEARASYDRAAGTLDQGRFDRLDDPDGDPIPMSTFVELRRAGWLVSPVVETAIAGTRILGIDPLTVPQAIFPVEGNEERIPPDLGSEGGVIWGAETEMANVLAALDPDPASFVVEAAPRRRLCRPAPCAGDRRAGECGVRPCREPGATSGPPPP